MELEEVLKENDGKKFDVVLMNPPYGTDGSQDLHYKFVDKILDISKYQITVMPFGLINKLSSKSLKYKNKFDKYLVSVDEVSSKLFKETAMNNVGIYIFDELKENNNINITYINGDTKIINSLHDINNFKNEIENKIFKLFKQNILETIYPIIGLKLKNPNEKILNWANKRLEKIKNYFDNNKNGAVLICNDANGGMNGMYISNKIGQIFTSYNDLYNFIKNVHPAYNLICLPSKKSIENIKIALKNPVLRLILLRIQDDQHMHINKCYKHIPNIDWSDDRVKTDEGLLEVCGCPKDKCKEYADYCKKVIEEVDKK